MARGVVIIAAAGPSPLWYLSRGTGAVTLVLLSTSVVLGITGTLRWRPGSLTPRFVVDGLHRNVSLLVVVLLAAHVVTALLDPFAHLRVVDAIVPLASSYRPLWLGLGALALDLLVALVVTSVVRARLGLRAWRAVHWAAYACWPVAVLHGLGTGTDTRSTWLEALTAACVAAVAVALAMRLLRGWPARSQLRLGGLVLTGAALAGGVAFVLQGPLKPGWARRAGTPVALLTATRPLARQRPAAAVRALALPFAATLGGTLRESRSPSDGSARIDIVARIDVPGNPAHLDLRLDGRALPGGGLVMSSSNVALGPEARPGMYRGHVTALNGDRVVARLAAPNERSVLLRLILRATPAGALSGAARAREAAE